MAKQRLNILVVAPLTAGLVNGGVRTQAVFTARFLKRDDVDVTLFNPWDPYNPADYDLVHLFTAGHETIGITNRLAGSGVKIAVSPVLFTRKKAGTVKLARLVEKTGNIFFSGIHTELSVKKEVCRQANLVLPNTSDEAELISKGFGIPQSKIRVIPNGVESRFADADPELFRNKFGLSDFTLFAGDASAPRKNLLPFLQNLTPDDKPFVIIGNIDNSHYSLECKNIINSSKNILHIGNLDHNDPLLASAYAAAGVFVMPSMFETPGIAAMEAALAGCKIAITEIGGTKEIFGDDAFYINPNSPDTMMDAVRNAHQKETSPHLKDRLMQNYTWDKVADQTLKAYRSVL